MFGEIYGVKKDQVQQRNFFGELDFINYTKLGHFSPQRIFDSANITLYALDIVNQRAIFVETPPEINLSIAPFYNLAQFENASKIITISFDTMIQLGDEVCLNDERIVLIYSVGRCGSTLASQIFAQIPDVVNMSEPIALTNLVVARNAKMFDKSYLLALLKATVRLLCKNKAQKSWVIKGRSFDIELGDWMHALFPRTKNIFLYRDAESWLKSSLRAFERNDDDSEVDTAKQNKEKREFMDSLVPEISDYDPEVPLSHVDLLSLMWLATMTRYLKWNDSGIDMLAIPYRYWKSDPLKTAEAMLDYCHLKPGDMSEILEVLGKDSQAGTRLSWNALRQNNRDITKTDLQILHGHLKDHPFIPKANFEVPNTLKFI